MGFVVVGFSAMVNLAVADFSPVTVGLAVAVASVIIELYKSFEREVVVRAWCPEMKSLRDVPQGFSRLVVGMGGNVCLFLDFTDAGLTVGSPVTVGSAVTGPPIDVD